VEATLGPKGIVADDCSCPIGGRCKHVAALLYTWIDDPDAFTTMDDVDTLLAKRSQAELTDLIHKMIDRYPDLVLLELPLPGARARANPSAGVISGRFVTPLPVQAMSGATRRCRRRVKGVVDTGDQYAQRRLAERDVYETIMRSCWTNMSWFRTKRRPGGS
jgi:hypothetical protein